MSHGVLFKLTDAGIPLARGNDVFFVARVSKSEESSGEDRNKIFLVRDVREIRNLRMYALG